MASLDHQVFLKDYVHICANKISIPDEEIEEIIRLSAECMPRRLLYQCIRYIRLLEVEFGYSLGVSAETTLLAYVADLYEECLSHKRYSTEEDFWTEKFWNIIVQVKYEDQLRSHSGSLEKLRVPVLLMVFLRINLTLDRE